MKGLRRRVPEFLPRVAEVSVDVAHGSGVLKPDGVYAEFQEKNVLFIHRTVTATMGCTTFYIIF